MNNTKLLALSMISGLVPNYNLFCQAIEKMNVLLIMSDDLNNDLGCYNHYLVKTPNLDRLASQGMVFNHAYCQFPLSGPSRASMLTGLRPEKTNMCINETNFRDALPNVITMPQQFIKDGYFAGRVGKIYHYGVPNEIGTDGHDDTLSWNKRVNPLGRDKLEENKIVNFVPSSNLGTAPAYLAAEGSDLEQTDGMVATETINMIKKNKDKPFFIATGFFRPHCPYVAPKKYFDMYPLDSIRLPKNPTNDQEDIPELGKNNGITHKTLTIEQQKQLHQAYYACISFIDAQVGRLLYALDSMGLSNNTIIVFMGDNGYQLGEHFLWGKNFLFEESSRIPLIIYNPAITHSNHLSNEFVELIDVYPTLTAMCGINSPAILDGKNMQCLFDGNNKNWKKSSVSIVSRPNGKADKTKVNWGFTYRGKSVRTERWRYIEWDEGKAGTELYDHENDPQEFNNLASNPEYKQVIVELKSMIK